MSEIDTQNAKQIRDPMDVLIEMELASDDVTLSYSGYSGTAKVADGELDEPTWPMRKLADLQGDGFSLDGSCVLYNSSTSPSQTNGKLGVRGNVGEAVTITITGNKSIASLFIFATGAESVTFGSTTTPIYNNVVTIPVGATSITITLNPASETTRIEVSQLEAGAKFRITNENLIRATVSLRSDLSIIDPTLPESEINIEAYQDTDISEAVAAIPENTPITYSAGYEGDMSPVRKFYVTGQVTWADNVLSIQGVDAVHFLEKELPSAICSGTTSSIFFLAEWLAEDTGISVARDTRPYSIGEDQWVIFERQSYRSVIATIMGYFCGGDPKTPSQSYYPAYIDAGIPTIRCQRKDPKWTIVEDDCADMKKNVEPRIGEIIWQSSFCEYDPIYGSNKQATKVGDASWYKNDAAFISLDEYVVGFQPALTNEELSKATQYGQWSSDGAIGILPATTTGYDYLYWKAPFQNSDLTGVYMLLDSEVLQGAAKDATMIDGEVYTQVIPWNCYFKPGQFDHIYWGNIRSMDDCWRYLTDIGIYENGLDSATLTLWGMKFVKTPTEDVFSAGAGVSRTVALDNVWGQIDTRTGGNFFPDKCIETLLEMSPVTGSFTWKGDPRMQPRDVVEWERLDGTTTIITLESITLTHEGGGTMAEITYREGVV